MMMLDRSVADACRRLPSFGARDQRGRSMAGLPGRIQTMARLPRRGSGRVRLFTYLPMMVAACERLAAGDAGAMIEESV